METTQKPAFYVSNDLLASGGKRFATYLVDIAMYYVISFIIGLIFGVLALIGYRAPLEWITGDPSAGIFFNIVFFIIYYLAFESLTGRTVGKYVAGTKVVWDDGNKPDLGTIGIRTLCRFIPFEAFSFLGETHRGWHDSLSKTYVVDVKKFEQAKLLNSEFNEIGNKGED